MPSAIPTREKWFTMIRGRPASADLDRCTALVFAYHLKPATDTDERLAVADELLHVTRAHLDAHGVAGPLSDVIGLLALSAEKEKRNIAKASRGWATVRKVFAPAGSPLGPTRTVQHRHAGDATPTSLGNYWLEALDPRHRSWGHMDRRIFDDWFNSATELDFWAWLEATGRAQDSGVKYLAPDQRWLYEVVLGQDRRLYRHDPPAHARGAGAVPLCRFSTRTLSTLFSGAGYAIWVCSPDGIFYSDSHVLNRFHHSSFLAGGRVLAGGEWVVDDGLIQLITHKTGHYMATPQNLLNALRLLQRGTDLSHTVVVQTDYAANRSRYLKAQDFIRAAGDAGKCQPIASGSGAPARSAGEAIQMAAYGAAYAFVK